MIPAGFGFVLIMVIFGAVSLFKGEGGCGTVLIYGLALFIMIIVVLSSFLFAM